MNEMWQIQDAKNKLSEVIARALKEGPQLITKHGEFFQASPLAALELLRDKSLPCKGLEI